MVTLSFAAGSRDSFMESLNQHGIFVDQLGVKYQVKAHDTKTIGEMKGSK